MKKIIILFLITVALSCNGKRKILHQDTTLDKFQEHKYLVDRVDSINNFYILYISDEYFKYQVISNKSNNINYERVHEGKYYHFKLSANLLEPKTVAAVNSYDLKNCNDVDSVTRICRERYMSGLFYASNLKGLVLLKND